MYLWTWTVEAGQQVAVGGQSLAGQAGEGGCSRCELRQLGGKMTRKRGSPLTEEEIRSHLHLN